MHIVHFLEKKKKSYSEIRKLLICFSGSPTLQMYQHFHVLFFKGGKIIFSGLLRYQVYTLIIYVTLIIYRTFLYLNIFQRKSKPFNIDMYYMLICWQPDEIVVINVYIVYNVHYYVECNIYRPTWMLDYGTFVWENQIKLLKVKKHFIILWYTNFI